MGQGLALGRYLSTMNTGGIHYKAPWSSVEKFDRTIQTVDLSGISVSFSDGGGVEGIEEIGGKNGPLPATFNCAMTGEGGTPIIVDGSGPNEGLVRGGGVHLVGYGAPGALAHGEGRHSWGG